LFDELAECDCAPGNVLYAHLHGCFRDGDFDTFVNCTDCVSTCGACDEGRVAIPVSSQPPMGSSLSHGAAARVKEPLGRHRHQNQKRVVNECPVVQQYEPCPCSDQPVADGESCTDSPPVALVSDRCDCCDSDPYAYPGSRFCSTKPRVCPDATTGDPSFDYNCDDHHNHTVVCEDYTDDDSEDLNDDIIHDTAGGRDRYIRGCQAANDSDTNANGVFGGTESESLGECRFNAMTVSCATTHGFCLERKRSTGQRIILSKRAMGDGGLEVNAPIECNDGVITDPEDYLPAPVPEGSCVEYIEECHTRPHMNPTGCHCDCDICVVVGQ